MKKIDLLNKPIILSLLFMFILFCISFSSDTLLTFLKFKTNIAALPIFWALAALLVGIIYTKIKKEPLSKNQKTKITLYSLFVLLTLFVVILTLMLDLLNAQPFHLVIDLLIMILPTLLIILSGLCIYPALDLGCIIANPDKTENTKKLKDCLLIISLTVIGMLFSKFNDSALNALKPTIIKYMAQKGYIRKTEPVKIEVKHFKDKTSISGIDFISTTNYANTELGYYYYIPKNIKKNKIQKAPFLIIVPGLSGNGQDIVTQPFKDFAQQNGFVIIAPSFKEDDNNWESKTSYQYPAAWSGKAFNKILSDFYDKQHIRSKELYIFGISAGAQFAQRYSLIYPETVTACFLCAPGGVTVPTSKQKTRFVITVGNKDIPIRKQEAARFYKSAKALGIDVKYKEYNIGHSLSKEQIQDSLVFFNGIKSN